MLLVALSNTIPHIENQCFWNPISLHYQSQYHIQLKRKICSLPGKAFPTHRTNIGLVNSAIVGADMVGHPVLPFKALLADGTLEGLLIRVGQLVAVQVVHVAEGLAAHVAAVVFLDRFGRFLLDVLLRHVAHGG